MLELFDHEFMPAPDKYYYDEHLGMFVKNPDFVEESEEMGSCGSLANIAVERLSDLPDWMIPPSRKQEIERYRARKRREKIAADEDRNQQSLITGSSRMQSGSVSPSVKRGPRGGRYTESRTKDGRPYRRYF